MPLSATVAGCVDFVLSPSAIAKELARIASHPYVATAVSPAGVAQETTETNASDSQSALSHKDFDQILLLLRNYAGVDFTSYKPNTIERRIARRMVLNKKTSLKDYASMLKENA